MAIRGIGANRSEPDPAGSFLNVQFKDIKADCVLANPPFNDSDWGGERLREQQKEEPQVDKEIQASLAMLGFGGKTK